MIYTGIVMFKHQKDTILKAILFGIISYLLAMLPLSLSSPQFYQKDSVLLIVFGMAIISALNRKFESHFRTEVE